MRHLRNRDDGFSLSELVVVLGLLGVILAAAWASFSVASKGSKSADRESMVAREISFPLLQCERLAIQQHKILTGTVDGRVVNPGNYLMAFKTDVDRDGNIETVIIEATIDGKLTITTAEDSEHGYETVVWSTANHNRGESTPLFTYYDGNGSVIDPSGGSVSSTAKSVKITVATEYDGRKYEDSRRVAFRNAYVD